jgi:NOL1/NOP2/sun family putative RNA methylase
MFLLLQFVWSAMHSSYFTPYNNSMASGIQSFPPVFLKRMEAFLGNEYSAFALALESEPVSGLRVNTLKVSLEEFKAITPFRLGKTVPWCRAAFYLGNEVKPGKHPYHLAGLYYLQDPSAMAPVELLAPRPGERVLDLAAAPGGKTTHLAALMNGKGLLVANDIKNKRIGHLTMNVERWGAGNVVITNETPEQLADHFGAFFDRVLVDAPCSGEGMFRRDPGTCADWSLEMVEGCALRQNLILRIAAKLVRPGGYLLYSTCTFAPEENEGVILRFLEGIPEFEVISLPLFQGFMRGRPEWLAVEAEGVVKRRKQAVVLEALQGAARLFPHRLEGDGHFVCMMKRVGRVFADEKLFPYSENKAVYLTKNMLGVWRGFLGETLAIDLAEDRLWVVRDRLYYIPERMPNLGRLRVVHPGVWLGTFRKDRFEPAHPLALFLRGDQARNVLSLPAKSAEAEAYLRGESLHVSGAPGWVLVCVDGFPLGWGKRVQGVVKNHYPHGWQIYSQEK